MSGVASTMKRDAYGKEYGATITSLALHRNQDFSPKPKGPVGDADFSTCQMVSTFAKGTGITNGTNVQPAIITALNSGVAAFVLTPVFEDLPQAAAFQALFDQYRIDKVEYKFVPQSNAVGVQAQASPNNNVPSLFVVADFDDQSVINNIPAIQEYDNCQVVPYGEGMFIELKPSNSFAMYDITGAAITGTSVQRAGWQDLPATGNVATPHYGIKGLVSELSASETNTYVWDVYAKYYLSFRNTR